MSASDTRQKLQGGGYLGMLNVLMQLRKVRPPQMTGEAVQPTGKQGQNCGQHHQPNCATLHAVGCCPAQPTRHSV